MKLVPWGGLSIRSDVIGDHHRQLEALCQHLQLSSCTCQYFLALQRLLPPKLPPHHCSDAINNQKCRPLSNDELLQRIKLLQEILRVFWGKHTYAWRHKWGERSTRKATRSKMVQSEAPIPTHYLLKSKYLEGRHLLWKSNLLRRYEII